jgi:hypothetical protein
MRRKVSL